MNFKEMEYLLAVEQEKKSVKGCQNSWNFTAGNEQMPQNGRG